MREELEKAFLSEPDEAVAFFSALERSPPRDWVSGQEEGQLAVDVMETEEEIVVVATMAGTKPEDIALHLHNDFLTIRGKRLPIVEATNYFTKECLWGNFSRTIVLPVDVKGDLARSEYKHGVLTIHLPKSKRTSSIPIVVVEE
ncbi:MAG: hypothetical protein A3I29_04515 [Candidatus Magasanikbacteria bacterium RIFCSPLOWO2_02_FULL_44_11]|uniref:SHSP domain-containing protein n=1 Tax=Candidatus Magasanikbacteria bacterium RIFCSPLOWO2_02_FULL_44_11 TaxID=1798689 RepID=A0A1F6N9H0_9BACT|nr:MAG: hypothetical protein A3I29_04515 [Candidatus Magasanikbacteria bacterium RIFCSPLOWO2_02_FULL_44_11]